MNVTSLKSVVLGLALGLSAQQALAKLNLNVDASLGRRWMESKVDGAKEKSTSYGNEYSLGAQYQIMDLPVSAGGSLSLVDINNKDLERGNTKVDTAYGVELGVAAKAWLPESVTQTDMVTPFVKLGYIAYSNYQLESKVGETKATTEASLPGFQVKVGADVAVNEDVAAVVEYSYTSQTQKGKVKVDGRKFDTDKSKVKSQAFLVGAQIRV